MGTQQRCRWAAEPRDCSIFSGWRDQTQVRFSCGSCFRDREKKAPVFTTTNFVHIPFEEAKMRRQFGAAYDGYVGAGGALAVRRAPAKAQPIPSGGQSNWEICAGGDQVGVLPH